MVSTIQIYITSVLWKNGNRMQKERYSEIKAVGQDMDYVAFAKTRFEPNETSDAS